MKAEGAGALPRARRTCTAAVSWPMVSWMGKGGRGRRVREGVGEFCCGGLVWGGGRNIGGVGLGLGCEGRGGGRTPPQGNWESWSSLKPRAGGESSVKWEKAGRRRARRRGRVVDIMVVRLCELGLGGGAKESREVVFGVVRLGGEIDGCLETCAIRDKQVQGDEYGNRRKEDVT